MARWRRSRNLALRSGRQSQRAVPAARDRSGSHEWCPAWSAHAPRCAAAARRSRSVDGACGRGCDCRRRSQAPLRPRRWAPTEKPAPLPKADVTAVPRTQPVMHSIDDSVTGLDQDGRMGSQGRRSTAAYAAVKHDQGTDIQAEHASGPRARVASTAEEPLGLEAARGGSAAAASATADLGKRDRTERATLRAPCIFLPSLCTAPG